MTESRSTRDPRPGSPTTGRVPLNNDAAPGAHPVRKKKRRTGLVVGILAVLVVLAVAAIVMTKKGAQDAVIVETQKVTTRTIRQTVTATGVIDPETQVKISPEVSGEIVYLGVVEGQVVTKGQVLVKINPQSMLAQRDEASAGILAAQARAAQSKASLLRSQQDLARVQQLFEKKLATNQELDAAQAQVKIGAAEADATRFQVAQSQASLRQVTESLNKTTIVAPLSGVVTKLNSKLGEKVVGAIQMTGTEIMTIADLSVIESVVNVSETNVVQVHSGDTADVEVDAIPNQKFKAVVSRIANSPKAAGVGTQEQITNFEVRLRFLDPDTRFRPGMTAFATIKTAEKADVLTVPVGSVTTREKKTDVQKAKSESDESGAKNVNIERAAKDNRPEPIVFVKLGDTVAARKVTTGISDDQYVEIVGGLKPGETVVSGSYKAISKDLEEGMRVAELPKETKTTPKGN